METKLIWYDIGVAAPVLPDAPLPPLPDMPRGAVVIVSGRAPLWLYARAFHLLHGSAAAAIATYDPRLGAVIVCSHTPLYYEGQVLDVQAP